MLLGKMEANKSTYNNPWGVNPIHVPNTSHPVNEVVGDPPE